MIAETKNKITLVATKEFVDFFEQESYRNGKSSLGFLEQQLPEFPITISFAPFDPFFEEFDEKIQKFVEAGLYDNFAYKYKNNRLFNEEVPPLVLTMDDLSIGFLFCSIPMALGVVVFMLEVITDKLTVLAEKLREIFVAVYVVVVVIRMKIYT